jgi:amino acid permease
MRAEAHGEVSLLADSFSFLAFSFLTSFIGFFLGLSDFFRDLLAGGGGSRGGGGGGDFVGKTPAYALAAVPPYAISVAFPDIFMAALDKARARRCERRLSVLDQQSSAARSCS